MRWRCFRTRPPGSGLGDGGWRRASPPLRGTSIDSAAAGTKAGRHTASFRSRARSSYGGSCPYPRGGAGRGGAAGFPSWSEMRRREVSALHWADIDDGAVGAGSSPGHRRSAGSRPRSLDSALTLGLIRGDYVNCDQAARRGRGWPRTGRSARWVPGRRRAAPGSAARRASPRVDPRGGSTARRRSTRSLQSATAEDQPPDCSGGARLRLLASSLVSG